MILKVLYTNAQSINNKIDELRVTVSDLKPDLVLICESFTNESISNAYLTISGYRLEVRKDGCDTTNGRARGLLIYVKDNIKAGELENSLFETFNQCCAIRVPWKNEDELSLVLAYRPPRTAKADDGNTSRLCSVIRGMKGPSVVIGDINLPGIDWERLYADSMGKEFLETVQDTFLSQHVDFPTHISGSTLDLVLSSSPDIVASVKPVGRLGSSDHEMLVIELAGPVTHDNTELVPDWSKADLNKMRNALSSIKWDEIFDGQDGNDCWDAFASIIQLETESCVPKKRRYCRSRPVWMTSNTIRIIRKKRRLWKHYTQTKDYDEYLSYKRVENAVKKAVRKAKRNFERTLAKSARKNPKAFYSYMKKKTSNKVSVGPLKDVEGNTVADDKEMADTLNAYFASVFTQEDVSSLPQPRRMFQGNDVLKDTQFTEDIIGAKLQKLKPTSAPGPDKLWPRILNQLADSISVPLAIIYTKCLKEGCVPKDWRLANVTPIFKKGAKGDPGNYRPISLTCVLCKVMEAVLRDDIVQHLGKQSLINSSQHGFTSGRSCLTNLLEFLEELTKLVDKGFPVDMIYLDFQKAFDRVPHQRLVLKLEAHGICGNILRWIKNWLSDRQQRVVLKGKVSSWVNVSSGVPQGSVLGPLLFLVYINDIDDAIDVTDTILKKFADDTKIGRAIRGVSDRMTLQE